MLNDAKHTETLKVWLTEREIVDLMRIAAEQDRKVSEMARVLLRAGMYGILGRRNLDDNEAIRGE